MITIKDDYGKEYNVTDLKRFKKHLLDYHSKNGKGDNSLHEENGYWFRVTESFYDKIMSIVEWFIVYKNQSLTFSEIVKYLKKILKMLSNIFKKLYFIRLWWTYYPKKSAI